MRDTEDALELITDIKDSKEERESYLRCVQTSIFIFCNQCQEGLLNDGLFIVTILLLSKRRKSQLVVVVILLPDFTSITSLQVCLYLSINKN